MNLANLPKYKLIMCDPQKYSNCDGMYKADDGNIVKFEEAVEASSNSLQQLKAEICRCEPVYPKIAVEGLIKMGFPFCPRCGGKLSAV